MSALIRIRVFGFFVLFFFRIGSDHFIVENGADSSIKVAVKKTNWTDSYPTYNTGYYQLNQDNEASCTFSHKNQTHEICKIFTHRLATKFTLRFRACKKSGACTHYSSWQTVWTLPPSKHTPQFNKVNFIPDKAQIVWSGSRPGTGVATEWNTFIGITLL